MTVKAGDVAGSGIRCFEQMYLPDDLENQKDKNKDHCQGNEKSHPSYQHPPVQRLLFIFVNKDGTIYMTAEPSIQTQRAGINQKLQQ
jgi:hypothetical protein